MAVTSDAMFNARTVVPSFMPSNLYCGYAPHCRQENQLNAMLGNVESTKPVVFSCYSCDSTMETDDDGADYSVASRYLNNHPAILEASIENRLNVNDKQQVEQPGTCNADTLQRGNRKRCNSDLAPATHLKRFRIEAVVRTMYAMVQEVQGTRDRLLCLVNQRHYM